MKKFEPGKGPDADKKKKKKFKRKPDGKPGDEKKMKPKEKKIKQDPDGMGNLVIDDGADDDESCSAGKCLRPTGVYLFCSLHIHVYFSHKRPFVR